MRQVKRKMSDKEIWDWLVKSMIPNKKAREKIRKELGLENRYKEKKNE